MIRVCFTGRTPKPSSFAIGNSGEHACEMVRFEGLPQYPGGAVHLCWKRGDTGDIETLENGEWTVNRTVTSVGRYVYAYIEVAVGTSIVWRSDPFTMTVGELPQAESVVAQQYPTAIAQGIADVEAAIANVRTIDARATHLSWDQPATAEIASDDMGLHLSVGIPRGMTGLQGDKGNKGDRGETGPRGVGVFAMSVNADGDLVLTYSDGDDPPAFSINEQGDLEVDF